MGGSRARVAMHFADGSVIDTWDHLSWKVAFTDPLDNLSFTSIPPLSQYATYKAMLAKGQLVTILINDVLQGAYLIQTAERTSSEHGAAIKVTLHTPLITPHEGDVDPDLSLASQTSVPVTAAILQAMAPYGFEEVRGDTRASVEAVTGKPIGGGTNTIDVPALKHSAVVAHAGTTAYNFCAHIFTRLGVCMRLSADGSLLVSAPDYTQPASYAVVRTTAPGTAIGDYFVGEVKVHDSNAGQYSAVTVRGQRNPGAPLGINSTNVARPNGYVAASDVLPALSAYSSFVAPWKPKYLADKKSTDPATALNVAHLELGAKAASAYYIEGTVDGWVASTGAIWQPDTVVHVVHTLEGLDQDMWIEEVERSQDATGGQTCKLKIIPLGALILGDPKALAKA